LKNLKSNLNVSLARSLAFSANVIQKSNIDAETKSNVHKFFVDLISIGKAIDIVNGIDLGSKSKLLNRDHRKSNDLDLDI